MKNKKIAVGIVLSGILFVTSGLFAEEKVEQKQQTQQPQRTQQTQQTQQPKVTEKKQMNLGKKAKAKTSQSWACSMKCEGEKTYSKSGKCPKCGMNLEKKK